MKKRIVISLLIVLLLSICSVSSGSESDIKVFIDGQEQVLSHAPLIDGGITLVPMRTFFEALGARVDWDAPTQTAIGFRDGVEIRLQINNKIASINGTETLLSIPAKVINDATYIPLRFVGEALGNQVCWDGQKREINVASGLESIGSIKELQVAFSQTGIASWYGNEFAGRSTANGERFDPAGLTAAHRTLPFGTYVRVTFLKTNESTVVRINDRGPFRSGRIIDLSRAAAEAIGLRPHGIGEILLEVLE